MKPNYKNADIAFVATFAAYEIKKNILEEPNIDYAPINRLSEILKEKAKNIEGNSKLITEIYNTMQEQGLCNNPKITIKDFAIKINHVAQKLSNVNRLNKQKLTDLRSFCLSLAEKTMWVEDYLNRLVV